MLNVPAPSIAYEAIAPGVAALELPLTVLWGPVTMDGFVLGPPDLETFALVTYRRLGAGSLLEVWAADTGEWLPATGNEHRDSQPLAFLEDQPQPWQGLVVASGAVDPAGAPVFARGTAGYPAYSFAGRFSGASGGAPEGLSASTAALSFSSVADRNLMVLGPAEGEKPEDATQARLQLRDVGLATIGGLVVERASPGATVTLSNSAGAAVVLLPDGSIELRPAPASPVVVTGDLETEKITYQPAAGGPRKSLS